MPEYIFYSFPAAPPMDGVASGISGDAAGGDKHGKNSATTNICIKPPYNPASSCTTHGGPGTPIPCINCHYHGSTVTNANASAPATRRTL